MGRNLAIMILMVFYIGMLAVVAHNAIEFVGQIENTLRESQNYVEGSE